MSEQAELPRECWLMAAWHEEPHREPSPAMQDWQGIWWKAELTHHASDPPVVVHCMGTVPPAVWSFPQRPENAR